MARYYGSKKEGKYDRFDNSKVAQTVTEDWGCPEATYAIDQKESGSMNYMSRKDAIKVRDAKKLKSGMLNMDGYRG